MELPIGLTCLVNKEIYQTVPPKHRISEIDGRLLTGGRTANVFVLQLVLGLSSCWSSLWSSSGVFTWIPWNSSLRYIIFHEKKTPNDAVATQRQSQFTPKMKANAIPRLLSSLVWIGQYNEWNRMTSFMEFMKNAYSTPWLYVPEYMIMTWNPWKL